MKILVLGASGLVGSHVVEAGRRAGHQMIGTYRETPQPALIRCDVLDIDGVTALLADAQPEAVVYCAGWTWVDGCEADPERAMRENAAAPAAVAQLCFRSGIHFTSISTSYVFDGTSGPYAEDAVPNPINTYSRSKLEGERRVLEVTGEAALIPRLICVYGAEARQKNFAYQVLAALQQGRELLLPSDQEGNPSYAGDIARWLIALLERRERGIWHLAGPWPECKRPEWAEKLTAAFQANGVEPHPSFAIKSVTTSQLQQSARRPLKAGMISLKTGALGFVPTDFAQTIRELAGAKL